MQQALDFDRLAPNMIVKIPVTRAGIPAIEEATYRGVSINATVCFTLPQCIAVAEAVERGLIRREKDGLPIDTMGPVDYLVVAFPTDRMTGEAFPMLVDLVDRGVIRILDLAFVRKEHDGTVTTLETKNILIATGSAARMLPGLEADSKTILTNIEILDLQPIPKTMAIIGAGAVGVEFASIFNRFGTKVTLFEMLPRLVPVEDEDVHAMVGGGIDLHLVHIGVCFVHIAPHGHTAAVGDIEFFGIDKPEIGFMNQRRGT